MTAAQLGYTFDVMFDSIANYSSPGFTNQEKSELLNQAQENIYLDVINPLTTPRSGAVLDELNKIIVAELIGNTGDLIPSNPSVLSSELLPSSALDWSITNVYWAKTGSLTFTHTPLTPPIPPTYSDYYEMNTTLTGNFTYTFVCTITNRTQGDITIYDGNGQTLASNVTSSFSLFLTSTSCRLQVACSPYFDGSVTLSLKKYITLSSFTNLPNGQFIELPLDFFFPLTEFADIQFLSTSYFYAFTNKFPNHISTNVYVKPISQLDFTNAFYSHIRKPYEDLVLRMEHERPYPTLPISNTNKKIYELFHNDEYVIYRYKASYYRRLVDIDIDNNITCELDPFIHRTLVKDAIKLAALTINDKDKYQMASIEKNN